MSIKLFVGGFPLDMEELALAQMIAPYGDIDTLKIVRDKKTRICKGYAFVEMVSEKGAAEVAAALDGFQMGDRELSVKLVTDTPAPAAPRYKKTGRPPSSSSASSSAEPARTKRPRRTV